MLEEARREEQLGLATTPCRLSGKPAVAGRNSSEAVKAQIRRHLKMFGVGSFQKEYQGYVISAQTLSPGCEGEQD